MTAAPQRNKYFSKNDLLGDVLLRLSLFSEVCVLFNKLTYHGGLCIMLYVSCMSILLCIVKQVQKAGQAEAIFYWWGHFFSLHY